MTLPAETDLTVREVADILGSTTKFIYTLVERGELTAIKYGQRFIRIPRAALDEFRAAHTTLAQKRAEILGPETVQAVAESAAAAPPLSEDKADAVRAAFRAPPKLPRYPQSRKGRK